MTDDDVVERATNHAEWLNRVKPSGYGSHARLNAALINEIKRLRSALSAAVKAERDACERVALVIVQNEGELARQTSHESQWRHQSAHDAANAILAGIRARSTP